MSSLSSYLPSAEDGFLPYYLLVVSLCNTLSPACLPYLATDPLPLS